MYFIILPSFVGETWKKFHPKMTQLTTVMHLNVLPHFTNFEQIEHPVEQKKERNTKNSNVELLYVDYNNSRNCTIINQSNLIKPADVYDPDEEPTEADLTADD